MRPRGLRALANSVGAGLLDQALASGVNFLTIILVARAAGPREFGYFALVFTLLQSLGALQLALVTRPHNVLAASRKGNDYIRYRHIEFKDDVVSLGDEIGPVHIILPAGETSFTSTGTHYVDHNGRMLISSSERWSHDRGDPYGYETRVDECAPAK